MERKVVCKLNEEVFKAYSGLLQLQSKMVYQTGLLFSNLTRLNEETMKVGRKVESEWARMKADNDLEVSKNYQIDMQTQEIVEIINDPEVCETEPKPTSKTAVLG